MKDMEWTAMLNGLTPEHRRACGFLFTHLPLSDIDCYPVEYFTGVAGHALMLRARFSWCAALDDELFYQYVLCPRVNDEELSPYHALFFHELCPRVDGLSEEEAVLEANRYCHEHATYEAQDERTASALTVYRSGSGRCGEESVLLVSALRSIGIAARQVYSERWSHCDDNHAWVEAYCGGAWRFLGACEPEPMLDRGWFNAAASRAMLIRSRAFGEASSSLHGELISREGGVTWFNQTARYAKTRKYTLVAHIAGKPAPGTQFHIQLLNEAAFHTVALLQAGGEGEASVTLGLGSFHVLAVNGGLYARRVCSEPRTVLDLCAMETPDGEWHEFDFIAPEACTQGLFALDAAHKRLRAETLARGDAIRRERMALLNGGGAGESAALLDEARANAGEIRAFLAGDDAAARLRFIKALRKKDLRDASCATLEGHFTNAVRLAGVPDDVFERFVRSPRIANEKLTPWRFPLQTWLKERLGAGNANAEGVRALLAKAVAETDGSRTYENLYWTPMEALNASRCDLKSFELLYIAALRALGVPARLRSADGVAEYWRDGCFYAVNEPYAARLSVPGLRGGTGLARWRNGAWQNGAWRNGAWRTVALAEENELPPGRYELITSVRSPNGNQYAARMEVCLVPGDEVSIAPHYRECSIDEMLGSWELPKICAATVLNETVTDAANSAKGVHLLLWLDTGTEPTEHLMNELIGCEERLAKAGIAVTAFLKNSESAAQRTFSTLAQRLENHIQILFDDWDYDVESVARLTGCDPQGSPLAIVCREGSAVFAFSGYRVGIAELLLDVAERAGAISHV